MATISLSSQTTLQDINNFFGFALYDASAPNTLLEIQTPPKPYGNPLQIMFLYNCIIGHQYIIKLWESADGSATGVIRNQWAGSVNGQSVLVRMPLYLKVGVTPGLTDGETLYEDATWQGWDYIMRRNSQTYIPDLPDVDGIPQYEQVPTGGMNLIDGTTFSDTEDFIIEFVPQVVSSPNGSPSGVFGTGQIIDVDTVFDGNHINQALCIQAAANKITCRFPSLATVPAFTWMYIYSEGGNHINVTFEADGTDKFWYNGEQTQMILAQREVLKAFKAPFGTSGAFVWVIDGDLAGWKQVGELVFSSSSNKINTIPCYGQLLNRDEYPRLLRWVQTLAAGHVVTDIMWNSFITDIDGNTIYPYKGKFSAGDGSTTFRLPLLTTAVIKGVDGTVRIAGDLELDAVGKHAHWMFQDTTQPDNTPLTGTDTVAEVGSSGGDYHYAMKIGTGPATHGLTSSTIRAGGVETFPTTENKIRTIGEYILIRY